MLTDGLVLGSGEGKLWRLHELKRADLVGRFKS